MQVSNVQVGNFIYPLVAEQPLLIAVGDTLKVNYSFKYSLTKNTSIRIWASLYVYNALGQLNRLGGAQTKKTIDLTATTVPMLYNGEIDIVVGNISAGKFGLLLELPDYPFDADHEVHIDNCLEITAIPNIWSMLGDLIPLIIMMLAMNLITTLTTPEGREKVKETVKEVVPIVISGVKAIV